MWRRDYFITLLTRGMIAMAPAIEYFSGTLQEERTIHIDISTNGFPVCQVTD